jgi:hypothetical protein
LLLRKINADNYFCLNTHYFNETYCIFVGEDPGKEGEQFIISSVPIRHSSQLGMSPSVEQIPLNQQHRAGPKSLSISNKKYSFFKEQNITHQLSSCLPFTSSCKTFFKWMLMPKEEQMPSICKWNRKTQAGGQVALLAELLARSWMA